MKKTMLAVLTMLSLAGTAQISGFHLPVTNISWEGFSLSTMVTASGFPGAYSTKVIAIALGDTVTISGDTITTTGTGIKTSPIAGLEPATTYMVTRIFWDSLSRDTLASVEVTTGPAPVAPVVSVRPIPRLGVSALELTVNVSGYTPTLYAVYGDDYSEESFPMIQRTGSFMDTTYLLTEEYGSYPWCLLVLYPEHVPLESGVIACHGMEVAIPPITEAPEIQMGTASADCGSVSLDQVSIIPFPEDTATVYAILVHGDVTDTIRVWDSITNIVTLFGITHDSVRADTEYRWYITTVSKDSETRTLFKAVTTPPGDSPTIVFVAENTEPTTLHIAGDPFCDNTEIQITVTSHEALYVFSTVFEAGSKPFEFQVTLPPEMPAGWHTIIVSAVNQYGSSEKDTVFFRGGVSTGLLDQKTPQDDFNPNGWVIAYNMAGQAVGSGRYYDRKRWLSGIGKQVIIFRDPQSGQRKEVVLY